MAYARKTSRRTNQRRSKTNRTSTARRRVSTRSTAGVRKRRVSSGSRRRTGATHIVLHIAGNPGVADAMTADARGAISKKSNAPVRARF